MKYMSKGENSSLYHDSRSTRTMIKVDVVLYYFVNFFSNTAIVGLLTLVLYMGEPITVCTLMKMNTFVSGVTLKAPLILFVMGFFVIPSISESVGCSLCLKTFFHRYFLGDVVNDGGAMQLYALAAPSHLATFSKSCQRRLN